MTILRRVLTAVALLTLLTGFLSACGDDDDAEETADDSSSAQDEFCADFNEGGGGDQAIETVQTSLDLAVAAQEDARTEEGAEAVGVLVEFAEYVIDNDDGDGIVTDAEVQAAVPEIEGIEDALALVTERCAPASRVDRDGYL